MWNKPHLLNALADLLMLVAAAALLAAAPGSPGDDRPSGEGTRDREADNWPGIGGMPSSASYRPDVGHSAVGVLGTTTRERPSHSSRQRSSRREASS